MKSFDPAVIIELAKEGFIFFLLVEFELLSGTLRYSDADIDIWYEDYRYSTADFVFDNVETTGDMGVDTVSLTFNNADLSMSALVLSEDILGRWFTLKFVVAKEGSAVLTEGEVSLLLEGGLVDGEKMLLDTPVTVGGYSVVGGHSLFYGIISDWELREKSIQIEVQNELVFWNKKSLRKCDSNCNWEFAGTECGYSGAQNWCNQSYERCKEIGNTDNFGGFRFLPAISEKEIWWGRTPE